MITRRSLILAAPALVAAPRIGRAFVYGRIPWSPFDIAPAAWQSADDYDLMTDDGSGLISNWKGRFGLAITAATTARGTWGAASWTPNGKPGITFDGVANCYVTTSLASLPTGATAGEIWVLAAAVGPGGTMIRYGGASSATDRAILCNNQARVNDSSTNLTNTGGINWNTAAIVGGYWSGTTEGGRFNGADFAPSSTATIASLNTGTARMRIGAANLGGASGFWPGVVRHVIITPLLSSANRLRMEGWMAWNGWATAAANPLPASHPYKYAAP